MDFIGEGAGVLLRRAGANQDARPSARLRALSITPNVALWRDSVQTLTVEFHSVASGCWSCFPHPHRCRRSIAGLSLTIGNHSVWSCCVRTDRRARLLGGCRSPSRFTVFRVVARRAIHIQTGVLVRLHADVHHRKAQGFECPAAAISTPVPAHPACGRRTRACIVATAGRPPG